MKSPISPKHALVLFLSVVITGCMLSPWDEYVVANEDRSFPVLGYHRSPNVDLQIEAWNVDASRFDVLATARTDSRATRTPGRDNVYGWWAGELTLAAPYWRDAACDGAYARVRTRETASGRSLYSVIRGWSTCWAENDYDLGAFVTQCTSDRSPEARVQTNDFADLAPDLAFAGNLRATGSGLFSMEVPLPRSRYDQVQMRTIHNGVTQIHTCQYRACRGVYMCTIPHVNDHGAPSREVAIATRGTAMSIRARDTRGCVNGTAYTDWSDPVGWYASAAAGVCPAPPPQPPEPVPPSEPGTWWNIQCVCANVNATTVASVRGCMDPTASAPQVGAALLCNSAELQIEAVIGVGVTCSLSTFGNTGTGPCNPGEFSIQSIL